MKDNRTGHAIDPASVLAPTVVTSIAMVAPVLGAADLIGAAGVSDGWTATAALATGACCAIGLHRPEWFPDAWLDPRLSWPNGAAVRTASVAVSVSLSGWWTLADVGGPIGWMLAGWQAAALSASVCLSFTGSWLRRWGKTRGSQRYMDRWAKRVEDRDASARSVVAQLQADALRLHKEAADALNAADRARREAEAIPVARELAEDLAAGAARRDPMREDLRDLVARDLLRETPDMSGNAFHAAMKAKGYGMDKGRALTLRKVLLIELATLAADRADDATRKVEGS